MTQRRQGTLFVEVRLDESAKQGFRDNEITAEIGRWIRENHTGVNIGTTVQPGGFCGIRALLLAVALHQVLTFVTQS